MLSSDRATALRQLQLQVRRASVRLTVCRPVLPAPVARQRPDLSRALLRVQERRQQRTSPGSSQNPEGSSQDPESFLARIAIHHQMMSKRDTLQFQYDQLEAQTLQQGVLGSARLPTQPHHRPGLYTHWYLHACSCGLCLQTSLDAKRVSDRASLRRSCTENVFPPLLYRM